MNRDLSSTETPLSGRCAKRYAIHVPVVITSATQAAAIEATVRDISSKGVFLNLPKDAIAGPRIDFALALPEQIASRQGVKVECKATVVRVERDSDDSIVGVAAKITRFRFTGPKANAT